MSKFYSAITSGFYDDTIHLLGSMPDDVLKITDKKHSDLLFGQSSGKQITADSNGMPVLTDPTPVVLSNRQVRDEALEALVHDFGDGRVMQGRPQDEQNIRVAIQTMEDNSIVTIDWVMQDNKKYSVTLDELKTARSSGQLAAMQVWNDYEPE